MLCYCVNNEKLQQLLIKWMKLASVWWYKKETISYINRKKQVFFMELTEFIPTFFSKDCELILQKFCFPTKTDTLLFLQMMEAQKRREGFATSPTLYLLEIKKSVIGKEHK